MRLRSSGYLGWSYLPPEIRHNILNTIVDQRNPRWSALASVSKEWQSVIGTRNMAKLSLRPSCLEDFEQAVIRQRNLVRHIYLNVELAEYGCSSCEKEFDVVTNSRLMGEAVIKLLIILSTWNTTTPLTLELNASSASDSKHWFKNFRFKDEHDAPYARDPVIPMEASHSDWHDPERGWENGVQTKPPPFTAHDQLFGRIDFDYYVPDAYVPEVNAVTRFMIRRQFRHHLRPQEFKNILSRFSRLTDVVYEPWPEEYASLYPDLWDLALIGAHMSNTLKRVILFQDSKQYLTESVLQIIQEYGVLLDPLGFESESDLPDNTKSIAQASLRLDELSVSFFIDAMNFFKACEKEWTWDQLQSLSLTSSLLFQSINGQKQRIDNLLIAAARLVLRMPNLTTMVLWNGGAGRACAFIYTRAKHYAHITWRGTWDLEISQKALQAWEDVAKLHSAELRAKHERLRETIRSHGDAIFHLNLPCQVIEPTSLWQIRMEDAQGL
ncbi:uncharacterized protein FMAN_11277 [Fusarium mangiferae]|uniref:DUF6546 domain-containing protein n=1 Tax=Fusarium mangiferae TaxID=192010 RepID=A0A1L7TLL6_FUSMA|nr:uncharacterized protein FMAN_11277 [Fusarium mangiferae]CVK97033.1 uncharacterized protein FMAN_11277 [Fusarium mangiferae]